MKGKGFPVHVMKSCSGCRGIAPFILPALNETDRLTSIPNRFAPARNHATHLPSGRFDPIAAPLPDNLCLKKHKIANHV